MNATRPFRASPVDHAALDGKPDNTEAIYREGAAWVGGVQTPRNSFLLTFDLGVTFP
jgi:hypothetical protein